LITTCHLFFWIIQDILLIFYYRTKRDIDLVKRRKKNDARMLIQEQKEKADCLMG